ncbi:hypothetical protein P4K82_13110 [Bacillus cereus]|nr:hypothetical protein [Bacillus cereus]
MLRYPVPLLHQGRNWRKATVKKLILDKHIGHLKDESYEAKEVYLVDFESNDNVTVGGFSVYVDIKTKKLVGYGYRD